MLRNVPDDWDNFWNTCPQGHRWHASDGRCEDCEEAYETAKAICDKYRGGDCPGCPIDANDCVELGLARCPLGDNPE